MWTWDNIQQDFPSNIQSRSIQNRQANHFSYFRILVLPVVQNFKGRSELICLFWCTNLQITLNLAKSRFIPHVAVCRPVKSFVVEHTFVIFGIGFEKKYYKYLLIMTRFQVLWITLMDVIFIINVNNWYLFDDYHLLCLIEWPGYKTEN